MKYLKWDVLYIYDDCMTSRCTILNSIESKNDGIT
jgi:hypothetical protein